MVGITKMQILATICAATTAVSAVAIQIPKLKGRDGQCGLTFHYQQDEGGANYGGAGGINSFGWDFWINTDGTGNGVTAAYSKVLDANTHWEFGVSKEDYNGNQNMYVFANYDPSNESWSSCGTSLDGGANIDGRTSTATYPDTVIEYDAYCYLNFPCN